MSDGAALPIRAHGTTRQAFLLSAALAAGAAAGPGVGRALAQTGGDADVLNFALTLEYLETRFYERALQRLPGLSSEVREVATILREHEREHAEILSRLIGQLGATPVREPRLEFGDAFTSEARFLAVAQRLEDTGVAAYNGAALRIVDRRVLEAAGEIVQVEARHAAAVRELRDEPPAPRAFDQVLPQSTVLRRVDPFLGS